jgi:Gpi18-like mannosyltransferase
MGEETIVKLSLISVLMIPFVAPQMHERFFFPADVISIVYAFYFPKYFYLPLLVGCSSLFSYFPFLFGNSPFPLTYLPIPILVTIILVSADLIRSLFLYPGDV